MSSLKYFTVKRKESYQTTSDCESQLQPVIEIVGIAEYDTEPEEASTQ